MSGNLTRRNRVNRMLTPPPSSQYSSPANAAANARAKRNYALAHRKSRVANVLGTPGEFKYTNKERIEKEYQMRIERIAESFGVPLDEIKEGMKDVKTVTQKESVATMRTLEQRIEEAIKRNPTAAVVTVTLSVGLAQLALKVLRIMVAFFVFWLALPLAIFNMFDGLPYLMKEMLPNTQFNTTRSWYEWIKGKTA